jgi:hypothetical protein
MFRDPHHGYGLKPCVILICRCQCFAERVGATVCNQSQLFLNPVFRSIDPQYPTTTPLIGYGAAFRVLQDSWRQDIHSMCSAQVVYLAPLLRRLRADNVSAFSEARPW